MEKIAICLFLIVGLMIFSFSLIADQQKDQDKRDKENKKALILKMKKENCVEVNVVYSNSSDDRYTYHCDGNKTYTLNFSADGGVK